MTKLRTLTQSLQAVEFGEAAIAFVNGTAPQPTETNGHSSKDESCAAVEVRASLETPDDSGLPGTVSMTFRLPAQLTARLLRISLDRKLKRKKPFTQQDIMAEALARWLKKEDDSL
jgi:hypothetical protein